MLWPRSRVGASPPLPGGFDLHVGGSGRLACRTGDLEPLQQAGFLLEGRHTGPDADRIGVARESGREPLGTFMLRGVPCLVRRFTHGGLARRLTGRRFRDPSRPFTELMLSERLRGAGVLTPAVIAARAVRVDPLGFELTLVTERVPGTVDCGELLGLVRSGERRRSELRSALRAAGRSIAELHGLGFVHADLQPANLLVDCVAHAERAWVVDLDRSQFSGASELPRSVRIANLGRLWRHVARRERDYGSVLGTRDRLRFLRGYGLRGVEAVEFAREVLAAAEARGGLHALGWWIERRWGRSIDRRAAGKRGGA